MGYICNMEIYSAEEVHSVIIFRQKVRPKSSHLSNNFYNSVRIAQTLLNRNVRICGTMRANRGIPHDPEGEGKCLKKGSQCSGGKVT